MTPQAPMLSVEDLSFAYAEAQALQDVTLQVAAGEFTAILGSNGSGKTTLMKVLLRLLKPAAGRVCLGGTDIKRLKPRDLYRQIGMVFQNPADQLFGATVEQDAAVGPRNLGLGDADVRARVEEALGAVGIAHLRERPIHHLSFGEQKRLCLAGVLAMEPRILVLDEPTAGLDGLGEIQMIELLRRLNTQRGITMILSTHNVDLLPGLATRIHVLCKGRLCRSGPPAEVFADAAWISSAGLRLPLLWQFFQEFSRDGLPMEQLPLDLAAARKQVLGWMGRNGEGSK